MLPTSIILTLFMACVSSLDYSAISVRQPAVNSNCTAPCAPFISVQGQCVTSQCRCTVSYLNTQMDCLVCQASNAEEITKIQLLMDAETNLCRSEGAEIENLPHLPSTAEEPVNTFVRQSGALRRNQTAFLVLQITGGHVTLVILLLSSVYSRAIHRDPTFFNFCITWIFSSVVFSINLYRGTAENNIADPLGPVDRGMCMAQAALVGGVQVMTACSKLAWVIQLWLNVRMVNSGGYTQKPKAALSIVLLAAPWILLLTFVVPTIVAGAHANSRAVSIGSAIPSAFYCIVAVDTLQRVVYAMSFGILFLAVIFDALIINILYWNWSHFLEIRAESTISLTVLLRVVVFSVYRVSVAVAYGTVVGSTLVHRIPQDEGFVSYYGASTWVELLQATIPLVASLVFGFNGDFIKSLMFWRNKRPIGY